MTARVTVRLFKGFITYLVLWALKNTRTVHKLLNYSGYNNNNNNNNTRTMFMVLSSCCSSIARVHPGSRGEPSTAPGSRRTLDQADRLEP